VTLPSDAQKVLNARVDLVRVLRDELELKRQVAVRQEFDV
jgi:hypothetical protein